MRGRPNLIFLSALVALSGCGYIEKFSRDSAGVNTTTVRVGAREPGAIHTKAVMNGGVLVYAVDLGDSGKRASIYLGDEDDTGSLTLTNGTYQFFALGYEESDLGSATNKFRCGKTGPITLDGTAQPIAIPISYADCADEDDFQLNGTYAGVENQAHPLLMVTCAGGGGKLSEVSVSGGDNVCDGGEGAAGPIEALVRDASTDKYYIGGNPTFLTLYGSTAIPALARIDSNGNIDTSFAPVGTFDQPIYDLAIDSSGKLLVVGDFSTYAGNSRGRIVRFNTDGSEDTSFNSGGAGADGTISAVALQSDGKIVIAGNFALYNGAGHSRIARLNNDGTVDGSFSTGSGFNNYVNDIDIDPSTQKIYAVGGFTSYNATTKNRIVRLDTTGAIDAGFSIGTGFNAATGTVAVDSAGSVIVSGPSVTSYNGSGIPGLVRIDNTGSIIGAPLGANAPVEGIVPYADGRVLLTGTFSNYAATGVPQGITRSNNLLNGVDAAFNQGGTGVSGGGALVRRAAVDDNGMIVIGGDFTTYNTQNSVRIARLNGAGGLDLYFSASRPHRSTAIGSFKISLAEYDMRSGGIASYASRISTACLTNATQGAHKTTDIRIPTGTFGTPIFGFVLETFGDAGCTGGTLKSTYFFSGGIAGSESEQKLLNVIVPTAASVSPSQAITRHLSNASWNWFFVREIQN